MRTGGSAENLVTAQPVGPLRQGRPLGGEPLLHCTQGWVRGSQGELRNAGWGGLCSKEEWEQGFGLQLRFPKWCFSPRREAPGRAGPRVTAPYSVQNALSYCLPAFLVGQRELCTCRVPAVMDRLPREQKQSHPLVREPHAHEFAASPLPLWPGPPPLACYQGPAVASGPIVSLVAASHAPVSHSPQEPRRIFFQSLGSSHSRVNQNYTRYVNR